MTTSSNPRLPFEDATPASAADARIAERDRQGRARAVDPRFNVVLEASAGTGKTRVLVDRYINLLRLGVDPSNILAITFTRKAAAEMRQRIVATLRAAAERGEIAPARWLELRDRTADIAISTIDAFCLSLLREFPLEADLDPGFSLADETEVPRLVDEALDRALRTCRSLAQEDERVALVFAQLGERRARRGLAALLQRRLVAPTVLATYLATGPRDLTVAAVVAGAGGALLDVFEAMRGGLEGFIHSGPAHPAFLLLARDLRRLRTALDAGEELDPVAVQTTFARAREHFLTQDGDARKKLHYKKALFPPGPAWTLHRDLVLEHGADILRVSHAYRRDLNVLVARGTSRMYAIAEAEYRRTLDAHAVLDFSDVLLRALDLLRQREEFAQSRFRLESRFHHLLVDEFQDTSRAQWELVALLIESWGAGEGAAYSGPLPPSIFIVGDRKQSIYAFRDADVSLLHEAARHLDALRPDGDVRRAISRSYRAVPALLAFVNDVCADVDKVPARSDAFEYAEQDRFPLDAPAVPARADDPALGLVIGDTAEACAETAAAEIARLIAAGATIRDRDSGLFRAVRPGDIAILFRTRESHREFEDALERRGIPAYVYKGLGFFDADETKDALALLWYLADPASDLRAAAVMRSRFVRLSDEGLRQLAPRLAGALLATDEPPQLSALDDADRQALLVARQAFAEWRGMVDRVPPAELLDVILAQSAYAVELRGPRFQQARENLKKLRALIRRIQNRGYATLGRIAAHLDRLSVGDESNASIDALDAVNLMTVHASKGLEFPVVFVVNLARGTGNRRDPIRLSGRDEHAAVAVGDFQSAADDDAAAREREETKRLLYVALTRARDRLYVGSTVADGVIQPGRGSLAEVLPRSLLAHFSSASVAADGVAQWQADSGSTHRLRLCAPPGEDEAARTRRPALPPAAQDDAADFTAVSAAPMSRRTIAAVLAAEGEPAVVRRGAASDRLLGTLVHRLLQRLGITSGAPPDGLHDIARQALRVDEVAAAIDVHDVIERAADAYLALCQREDVQALYQTGERLHEVPFTMRSGQSFLRGTIDCLVRQDDRMILLEFKTGRPRPEHQVQIDLYLQAAGQMFPGVTIDARLIYAHEQGNHSRNGAV